MGIKSGEEWMNIRVERLGEGRGCLDVKGKEGENIVGEG